MSVDIVKYLVPAFLLVILGTVLFSSTGRDDVYITYWPAHTLAHFGEILNYNGQRVEQSSSLLQVVFLAFVHMTSGIDLVVLGRVLSVLCGVFSLLIVHRLALRVHPHIGFCTALLSGTSAYFVYWSFGGLESTLVSLTALWLILSCGSYLSEARISDLLRSIVATILFITVRPEAPIVLIFTLLAATVAVCLKKYFAVTDSENALRVIRVRLLRLLGISVVLCLLLFIFRFLYFDSLFPQPVTAKSVFTSLGTVWQAFDKGSHRFLECILLTPSALLVTLVIVLGVRYAIQRSCKAERINPYVLLSLLFLAAYLSFIISSGGDWMEGARFFVPVIPIAVMFIPFLLYSLIQSKQALRASVLLLLVLQIQMAASLARERSTGMPIWQALDHYESFAKGYGASDFSWFERTNRVHMRDIPTLYHLNKTIDRLIAFKKDKLSILSYQMGTVRYHIAKRHFARIRSIDMRSLTDSVFTGFEMTSGASRNSYGMNVSYEEFFDNYQAIERDTGVTRPDIIYNLCDHGNIPAVIEDNGYTTLYLQTGSITIDSKWLPGKAIPADQFIAVRNDLMPALTGLEKTHLEFERLLP